jgi:hypothetical protein
VRIKQGKEKKREEGRRRKNESEQGLKKNPILIILSCPRKDVLLWWLQIATFFFSLT